MSTVPSPEKNQSAQRLRHVLTGQILSTEGQRWPGCDGLTIDDVLLAYPAAARLGRVPNRNELCQCHPELGPAIAAFFDDARPEPEGAIG